MYAVTAEGAIDRGFFAFRRMMWLSPLTWPLVPLFYPRAPVSWDHGSARGSRGTAIASAAGPRSAHCPKPTVPPSRQGTPDRIGVTG